MVEEKGREEERKEIREEGRNVGKEEEEQLLIERGKEVGGRRERGGWSFVPIILGQVLIYPLDTIRRRMQVNGSFDHLKVGYAKGSLLSGIGVGMIRWGGLMAIQMELMQEGREIWKE